MCQRQNTQPAELWDISKKGCFQLRGVSKLLLGDIGVTRDPMEDQLLHLEGFSFCDAKHRKKTPTKYLPNFYGVALQPPRNSKAGCQIFELSLVFKRSLPWQP